MKYRILIEPFGVYVKESEFFKSQGGEREAWGRKWIEVEADSIEDARLKGFDIRRKDEFKRISAN